MRLKLDCDSCGHNFSVSDEYLGRRVRCPSCGEPVRVAPVDGSTRSPNRQRSVNSTGSAAKSRKAADANSGMKWLAIGLGIGGGVVVLGLLIAVVFLRPTEKPQLVANAAPAAVTPTPPAAAPITNQPSVDSAAPLRNDQSAVTVTKPSIALPAEQPAVVSPSTPPAPQLDPPASSPPTVAEADPQPEQTPQTETPSGDAPPQLSGVPEPSSAELKLPQLIQRVEPSVVRINVVTEQGAGTGSGFVVSNDGTVVTNYHVVTSAQKADVEFADGTKTKVLGYRHLVPKSDIAIIKIDLPASKLKPAPLAVKLPLKGESVAAFGAPLGLSFTASQGAITAIRNQDDLSAELGVDLKGTWLQTDAAISPGNSGGPLSDHYGRIVGMNTMQLTVGQNLNFAVSSLEINEALKEAPQKIKELKPEDLRPYQKELSRKRAAEEIGTPRGRKLFAGVEEIYLVNYAYVKNYDPTNALWARVIQRSQKAVQKSGIHLSFGEPANDAALLKVYLEMKQSRKKAQGTQELRVRAELVCYDPQAKKNESPLVLVWKDERELGTVSLNSATNGTVPSGVDENLSRFFTSFRGAYNRAVKEYKEDEAKAKNGAEPEAAPSDGK